MKNLLINIRLYFLRLNRNYYYELIYDNQVNPSNEDIENYISTCNKIEFLKELKIFYSKNLRS